MKTPTSTIFLAPISLASICRIAMLSGGLTMPARGCCRDTCANGKHHMVAEICVLKSIGCTSPCDMSAHAVRAKCQCMRCRCMMYGACGMATNLAACPLMRSDPPKCVVKQEEWNFLASPAANSPIPDAFARSVRPSTHRWALRVCCRQFPGASSWLSRAK